LTVNAPVALALLVAAFISIAALSGGGIPDHVGAPRDPDRLGAPVISKLPWLKASTAVYLGTAVAVPAAATLVQNSSFTGILLGLIGCIALGVLVTDALRAERIERERMFVVFILISFSMLFFAFFEQAGSSLNNFTDRNVDRIVAGTALTDADVGRILDRIPISSAILGRTINDRQWTLTMVDAAHAAARQAVIAAPPKSTVEDLQHRADEAGVRAALAVSSSKPTINDPSSATESDPIRGSVADDETKANDDSSTDWATNLQRAVMAKELQPALKSVEVTRDLVGMKVGGRELKASVFQAANPVYILVFGLLLTFVWKLMASRGIEPNTIVKFALALFQLGLGFAALWLGAQNCSTYGIVGIEWLLVAYLFHTTGELCLSPVGLSMVTKLSPARLVSTVMGAWFLAAAFSNYVAGMIAGLTGVGHGDASGNTLIPLPIETVHVYGSVFAKIAIASGISGLILLAMSPWLVNWMHPETVNNEVAGH
jgi:dipeptide/tripeptide permease